MKYVTINFPDDFLEKLDRWATGRGLARNGAIMELYRLANLLPAFDAKAAEAAHYQSLFGGPPVARLDEPVGGRFVDLEPVEPEG